jgi:hypothetical protein
MGGDLSAATAVITTSTPLTTIAFRFYQIFLPDLRIQSKLNH